METIRTLNKWANNHFSLSMDALRMIVGVFLFIKGIQFQSQTEMLMGLILPASQSEMSAMFIAHYVTLAHFAGGILVFFGLLTRIAMLFQLPIFIGAVIINTINGVDSFIMAQAIFGLVTCIAFILYGSGRYSIDYKWKLGQ